MYRDADGMLHNEPDRVELGCCDEETADDMTVSAPSSQTKAWHAGFTIEKYHGDPEFAAGPYEIVHVDENIALTAGIALLLNLLIGAGGTTFANANARICVGDSSTAAAVGQTDMQAASNKLRKAMDATYPSLSGTTLTFRSTFATGDANFAWNEWGLANAAAAGTMLNRRVASMGTKTVADTWVATATLTAS